MALERHFQVQGETLASKIAHFSYNLLLPDCFDLVDFG